MGCVLTNYSSQLHQSQRDGGLKSWNVLDAYTQLSYCPRSPCPPSPRPELVPSLELLQPPAALCRRIWPPLHRPSFLMALLIDSRFPEPQAGRAGRPGPPCCHVRLGANDSTLWFDVSCPNLSSAQYNYGEPVMRV